MRTYRRTSAGAGLAAALALLLAGAPAVAGSFSDLKPAAPQPAEGAVAPGLVVNYVFALVHHVDEIEAQGPGEPGAPLPQLDYRSGAGTVLTSDKTDGVGALIGGLIRFPEPGRWLLAAQSNDGLRVRLAGAVVIEDPDVHADRYSENAEINIAEPGWYEIRITYFERKNTSTLQLYWQPPGADGFEIVPAAAFGHVR
jgi:hypothetical protein